MFPSNVRITVDIPSLDALVAYFLARDNAQKQINELTARVTEMTGRLTAANQGLAASESKA